MVDKITGINQYFFWECYLIEFYKKIRAEVKAMPEEVRVEEKDKIFKQQTYLDLFLSRLVYDPGIYKYVCEEILKDPKILGLTKLFIERCIFENSTYINKHLFNINLNKSYVDEYFSSLGPEKTELSEDITSDLNSLQQAKLEFLFYRFDKAENHAEYDEAGVIKIIIQEYLSNKKLIYRYIDSSDFYEGPSADYTEKWDYLGKKLSIEKINYYDLYQQAKDRDTTINPVMIGICMELKSRILKMLEHIKFLAHDNNLEINNAIINDIITVASVIWFNNLTEQQKVILLNNYYPFDESSFRKEKDEILKFLGPYLSLEYTKLLFDIGLIDCSGVLCQAILRSKGITDDIKCSCHVRLAEIFLLSGNNEKMVKNYLGALNIAKKNLSHPQALASFFNICLYLMAYYRSNNKLMEYQKLLYDYRTILYNIPDNHNKLLENQHQAILNKIDNDPGFTFTTFLNKIILPDQLHGTTSDMIDLIISNEKSTYNNVQLEKVKSTEMYKYYRDIGTKLFHYFQFDHASYWFFKAQKINDNTDIQGWFGIICYYSKKYSRSREIFTDMINKDDSEISAHIYLSAMDAMDGSIDSSIAHLHKIIDHTFKTYRTYKLSYYLLPENHIKNIKNAYIANIRLLMKELIYLGKKTEMLYIFEESIESAEKYISKSQYYQDIAYSLTDMGLFDDGKEYFFKSLASNPSEDLKPIILCNLGTNYANQNDHPNAISFYLQAIGCYPEYHDAWQNKAMSEVYIGKAGDAWDSINRAKEIFLKRHSDVYDSDYYRREIQIIERQLNFIAIYKNLINVDIVADEDIKQILLTAEFLTLKMERVNLNFKAFDFSTALVEYGKALELMLHKRISLKIKESISEEFGTHINNLYWNGGKNCEELDYPLKDLLNKNKTKTISIGSWYYLIIKLDKPSNNPVMVLFKKSIDDMFTSNELEKIKNACFTISDYRNGSSHYSTKSLEEVYEIRRQIIALLRDVIEVVYKA